MHVRAHERDPLYGMGGENSSHANGGDGQKGEVGAVEAAPEPQTREDSIMAFEKLGVCKDLAESAVGLGWKKPSIIQQQAVPLVLADRDVIGLAQTGSGKTGAFALPILQALLNKPQAFHTLVLSPTRELAIQISQQFEALGAGIGVRSAVLVGGIDMMSQAIAIAKRPHIIVGTPGRVVDHLTNTKGFTLKGLKHLVLDEADRLLNMDFEEEIDQILKVIPRNRRTQLFSATMTNKVAKLQRACLQDPVKVEVAAKYSTVDTLRQQYVFCPGTLLDVWLMVFGEVTALCCRLPSLARSLILCLIFAHYSHPSHPFDRCRQQSTRIVI